MCSVLRRVLPPRLRRGANPLASVVSVNSRNTSSSESPDSLSSFCVSPSGVGSGSIRVMTSLRRRRCAPSSHWVTGIKEELCPVTALGSQTSVLTVLASMFVGDTRDDKDPDMADAERRMRVDRALETRINDARSSALKSIQRL